MNHKEKNKKIGAMPRQRREALGLSQLEVAEHVNVTKSAISRWENGEVGNMGRSKIQSIAEILKISPISIVLGEGFEYDYILPYQTKRIPLLGEIAAGEPLLVAESHETYLAVDSTLKVDFCLKIKGDSMVDARINDGDIVFIKKQSCVENGEIAAVLIDGEATLKRFYKNNGGVILKPENSKYQPWYYTEKDFKDVKVLGKAVLFQSYI